jgi:hypothetical protein
LPPRLALRVPTVCSERPASSKKIAVLLVPSTASFTPEWNSDSRACFQARLAVTDVAWERVPSAGLRSV